MHTPFHTIIDIIVEILQFAKYPIAATFWLAVAAVSLIGLIWLLASLALSSF